MDIMKLVKIKQNGEYLLFDNDLEITDEGIMGLCLATTNPSIMPAEIKLGVIKKENIDEFILTDESTNIWEVKVSKQDDEYFIHLNDQLI